MPDLSLGDNNQSGDITTGDMAGGNIYHGARADNLIDLVRYQIDKQAQFNMLLVTSLERQQKAIESKIALLRLIVALALIIILLLLWSLR